MIINWGWKSIIMIDNFQHLLKDPSTYIYFNTVPIQFHHFHEWKKNQNYNLKRWNENSCKKGRVNIIPENNNKNQEDH